MIIALMLAFLLLQDDYPRMETSAGYASLANLGFSPRFNRETGRHSGIANSMSLNLKRNFALENYLGIYNLGQAITPLPERTTWSTLVTDTVGGKVMWRNSRVVPYASAGIGFGYFMRRTGGFLFTAGRMDPTITFSTRLGAGVEIPFSDSFAWKVEASRLAFHTRVDVFSTAAWTSGTNFSTGLVFR